MPSNQIRRTCRACALPKLKREFYDETQSYCIECQKKYARTVTPARRAMALNFLRGAMR